MYFSPPPAQVGSLDGFEVHEVVIEPSSSRPEIIARG